MNKEQHKQTTAAARPEKTKTANITTMTPTPTNGSSAAAARAESSEEVPGMCSAVTGSLPLDLVRVERGIGALRALYLGEILGRLVC